MLLFTKSDRLSQVKYDIRGPVQEQAIALEKAGHSIIKLNIGNLAPFGFDVPEEIQNGLAKLLSKCGGYSDSRGVWSVRETVLADCQKKNIAGVSIDDIFLGNGASELTLCVTQALLNEGDEVLIPAPDYPLWSAAVNLAGGVPVYYLCDEAAQWMPDIDDMRSKISPRTKAIVVINPNNPTGALYSKEVLMQIVELARKNKLMLLADEVYDKIIYDDLPYTPIATLSDDVITLTFNSLSKGYHACGYRSGWLVISGLNHENRARIKGFLEGITLLASMRLCPNVPGQYALQLALNSQLNNQDLVKPGGRLYEQRQRAYDAITSIKGVSCVLPKATFYMFPKLSSEFYEFSHDQQFALDLLKNEHVLIVPGSGFNWPNYDHFRLVFLPQLSQLNEAIHRIGHFLLQQIKHKSIV